MDGYDSRWDEGRERGGSWDRDRGSRAGSGERDRNEKDDPRDVFTKDLDLPRGQERELVRDRERIYEINGTESRLLATVGAFRVVSERDMQHRHGGDQDTRSDLRHVQQEGLVRSSPLCPGYRALVLTDRGRDLLEANRCDRAQEPRQAFHAGLKKPRELTHDTTVYRAYVRTEERLRERGGRVRRVVLDYELKREYQRFLHERNRGRRDRDGRPDREPEEIALGRASTSCRTSTSMCTSPTPASITRTATA